MEMMWKAALGWAKEAKKTMVSRKAAIYEKESRIHVMSFNVLWDDKKDVEHSWKKRKDKVASVIRFHHTDIVGLQEPTKEQMEDLETYLPEYRVADDEENGASNFILFRKTRFEPLEKGFFFLSPTPDVSSKGWDAPYLRGVGWIKLKDKKTLKEFYFFNTHFDYHSRLSRDESAKLLKIKVREIAVTFPFIVTGDFNLFPELGGKETYELLTRDDLLLDAQRRALFPHHGPTGSWSGFKEAGQPGIKPDYIFVSPRITVITHGILTDTFDGSFPSDHLPVVAEVDIN